MLKRLERDAIKADLAAVEALLKGRTQDEDPVGFFQFSRRIEELNRRLSDLDLAPTANSEVALFFGGKPVVGSHGIQADFGAAAIADFQNLVSSAFAAAGGTLGARGPVPGRDRSQLMLTDIARGSFGFVMQPFESPQLFDDGTQENLSSAIDLIYRVASPDQEAFEQVIENVDGRVLNNIRSFFKTLDDAGATLRVVEDRREFTLRHEEITRGRERSESVTFDERDSDTRGIIYILPSARRFELHSDGNIIKGSIAHDCLVQLTDGGTEVRLGIIGTVKNVLLRIREIKARGSDVRKSYTLLSVASDLDSPAAQLLSE